MTCKLLTVTLPERKLQYHEERNSTYIQLFCCSEPVRAATLETFQTEGKGAEEDLNGGPGGRWWLCEPHNGWEGRWKAAAGRVAHCLGHHAIGSYPCQGPYDGCLCTRIHTLNQVTHRHPPLRNPVRTMSSGDQRMKIGAGLWDLEAPSHELAQQAVGARSVAGLMVWGKRAATPITEQPCLRCTLLIPNNKLMYHLSELPVGISECLMTIHPALANNQMATILNLRFWGGG